MKAITLMYDSLRRNYLPFYEGARTDVIAPNFQRFADKSVIFDNCYGGSMPCMPARRELHTGRYNFLHRSWGPLEPFDDSMPEILSNNGICTQSVSDHCHYWQDGGLTYHTRFHAFEMVRGQEGDEWHGRAKNYGKKRMPRRMDPINREYTRDENCCHARCFDVAKDFILQNKNEDNWYLHLEYFDPHEPFDAPDKYKKMYTDHPTDKDWPMYKPVSEQTDTDDEILNYKACLTMCDDYLGRLMDLMDECDLWKDTMVILCTDHGYMLGEHGLMAKNYMPCYDEIIHNPFVIYDPRNRENAGQHRTALCQTIDIAPTILDWFGKDIPSHMQGKSLLKTLEDDSKIHDYALFGYFGKHINITDGRYVYMRAARDNSELYEYTLMPTRLAEMFGREELRETVGLERGFEFADHVPMLKIPAHAGAISGPSHLQYDDHMAWGDLLFDLDSDREENHNLVNDRPDLVEMLASEMKKLMKESDAPSEQYERMGL